MYAFFGKMPIQILCPFKRCISSFLAVLRLPCCSGFSPVTAVVRGWGTAIQVQRAGFSCYRRQALGHVGFRSCGALGLVAPRGSRDRTCVACIGRQILYHRATWEARSVSAALLSEFTSPQRRPRDKNSRAYFGGDSRKRSKGQGK